MFRLLVENVKKTCAFIVIIGHILIRIEGKLELSNCYKLGKCAQAGLKAGRLETQ